MRPEFFGLVRQFVDAWNRHDVTALNLFYSVNAVRETPGGGRQEGIDALRKCHEAMLRAFPDLTMDYRHEFTAGSHGVLEWTIKGTQSGPLDTPWGIVPASGKWVEFTGILVWEMDDRGYIIREKLYADFAGLLSQLDAMKVATPV